MIVHDLGTEAVASMARVDLATVSEEPSSPIGMFPFHDCVCGVGSFIGRPPWERHTTGDELLHLLSGSCELTVYETTGVTTRTLSSGDLVIVPNGCWHNNAAADGVTMFFITPRDGNQYSFDDPVSEAPVAS